MQPETMVYEHVTTPIGRMRIVTDAEERLCAFDWDDPPLRNIALRPGTVARSVVQAIERYFHGDFGVLSTVAIRMHGTAFQREVWQALRSIPVGTTWSYSGVAIAINRAKAVRAVGLANGVNPISVVVPCHRVIGANGSLTGYGGGLARKEWLLRHERALRED